MNNFWSTRRARVAAGSGVWQRHWQKIIALAGWLLLLAGYQWYAWQRDLTALEAATALIAFIATSPWGPLLYILAYTVRPLVLFPALLLSAGGGWLFGPLLGLLYATIGSNLSATVAYLIGRFFGQGLLQPEAAQSGGLVQRYAERMRAQSFVTILTMRFVLVPYDLVNYLAGLLRIDFRAFLLATVLGSIPGSVAFVLAGASAYAAGGPSFSGLPSFDPRVFAASAALFVLSLGIARLIKRREGRAAT